MVQFQSLAWLLISFGRVTTMFCNKVNIVQCRLFKWRTIERPNNPENTKQKKSKSFITLHGWCSTFRLEVGVSVKEKLFETMTCFPQISRGVSEYGTAQYSRTAHSWCLKRNPDYKVCKNVNCWANFN